MRTPVPEPEVRRGVASHADDRSRDGVRPRREVVATGGTGHADQGAPPTDPGNLLRRARLLGHRVGGPSDQPGTVPVAPTAPSVQRDIFLADEGTNLYKDEKKPELNLAYIGKTSHKFGNRPLFIPYGDVATIQKAARDGWQESVVEAGLVSHAPDPDAWIYQFMLDHFSDYAGVLRETDTGDVVSHEMPPEALAQRLADVVRYGAQYWNRGGGTRLPVAKGRLVRELEFLDPVPSKDASEEEVFGPIFESLGISWDERQKKYSGVTTELTDEVGFGELKQTLAKSGTPFFALDNYLYIGQATMDPRANPQVVAAKKVYSADFHGVDEKAQKDLAESFKSIGAPEVQGWVRVRGGRGREQDQRKAMNDWSALGAAAFANRFLGMKLDLKASWEWLHLRGAQIGGATKAGNLVPGLYATNSQMIPYEKKIQQWAEMPGEVEVRIYADRIHHRILAERIVLEIAAKDHQALGTIPRDDPAQVIFYPLRGQVVDKLENRMAQKLLERHLRLKAWRFGLKQKKQPSDDQAASSSTFAMEMVASSSSSAMEDD